MSTQKREKMSYDQHQSSAKSIVAKCVIITLSDTRSLETDVSGKRIAELLKSEGHIVLEHHVIRDDADRFAELLKEFLGLGDVDAILTNGGTGISGRDRTIGVVEKILDLPLPGFGELFRMLSWNEIGSGAMLSRATGGIARGKILLAMPGSTAAVELAMTKLILPELRHLLQQLRK